METLTRFLEEIHLGVIDDPHTQSRVVLTEKVTVCPACRSLHTLRLEGNIISCSVCDWGSTAPAHRAGKSRRAVA